jgi:hypothetical protein
MPSEEFKEGFDDGWRAAMERMGYNERVRTATSSRSSAPAPQKKKRKASAYSKRYGREFKRLSPKYKLKRGGWAKDGFKRAQAAAHAATKKAMK